MRDKTEWFELVEHNLNVLVGAERETIISAFKDHAFSEDFNVDLYGDGSASRTIVNALVAYDE